MRWPSQRQHPRATAGNGSTETEGQRQRASLLAAHARILDAPSETRVIVLLQVRSFRCRAVLGPPSPSVSQKRYLQTRRTLHLPSPGTVTFAIAADLPDELVALLREHGTRSKRAQYAEAMMTRLRRGAMPAGRIH
jgi:hypothetical protein